MKVVIRALLIFITRILFRIEMRGDPNQLRAEKLLVIANHESFLDGLLLGLYLPINPVFVVHTGIANTWYFKLILSLVDYLAVDPMNPLAMKKVFRLVESGRPVVIFPEGRITVTGSLMKIYNGPAYVAARTGATIVPVRIDGASRTYFSRMSGNYPKRWFPKITLSILKPTNMPMPVAPTAKEKRRIAGEEMRKMMQQMVFEARPNQTLWSAFCDAMDVYGSDRPIVEDATLTEHTYAGLMQTALGLGKLISKKTDINERVGVLMPNIAPTISMIFGLNAFKRTPAMLNYSTGVDSLQACIDAAKLRVIITSRKFITMGRLEDLVSKLQNVEVIYLEDIKSLLTIADKGWVALVGTKFPRLIEHDTSPEDAAVVLFTSGSEGKPKGVVLPHRALLANIAQVKAVVDFTTEDKVLNALPLFHSFGLTCGTLLPILTGTRLFLYVSPLHYRNIPEIAYSQHCTVLFGTNTFLANYGKFANPYDFYRVRYVVAGAEKLSDAVRNLWFEKFGIRIFEGYGATETAPVISVNTPMAYRTGTVGQVLPGIETRLVSVPGIDNGGMLHVRGDNIMAGYLKQDKPGVLQPPSSELGDGWYETGDIVNIDSDHFMKIVGRVKRFAKIAGEMVSLETVEKIAVGASSTGQHAASSRPDPSKGEALVLFTTDKTLTRERMNTYAKEHGLPDLAIPRDIRYIDAIPLLGTGKVDYVTVKTMATST